MTEKVLNYGDVCLRRADVDLLHGHQWLNDQVISFWFEYLARDKYKDLVDAHKVLLVPPSFTFVLASASSPEEASMLMETMQAEQADLVVFAINDSTDPNEANSGSHWTILAFERSSSTFRHYDSAPGTNAVSNQAAHRIIATTKGALGVPCHSQDDMWEVKTMPRQQNGFDCGVYACAMADMLCHWQAQGKSCQQQEPSLNLGLQREVARWRCDTQGLVDRIIMGR